MAGARDPSATEAGLTPTGRADEPPIRKDSTSWNLERLFDYRQDFSEARPHSALDHRTLSTPMLEVA
jgi:hypothetical protein